MIIFRPGPKTADGMIKANWKSAFIKNEHHHHNKGVPNQ